MDLGREVPTTKAEASYRAIREAILSGQLAPGTRLVLRQLASRLGVSDIPVREALKRLQAEGFIHTVAHVGAVVAEISGLDTLQNLMLRAELEALAARLAVPFVTENTLADLERMVAQMDGYLADQDWTAYARVNKAFHLHLSQASPFPYIRDLVTQLWEVGERTRILFRKGELARSGQAEHREMLKALRHRQADRLAQLVWSQKLRSATLLIEQLEGEERELARRLMQSWPHQFLTVPGAAEGL